MDKVDEAKDKAMDAKDVFVEKVGEENIQMAKDKVKNVVNQAKDIVSEFVGKDDYEEVYTHDFNEDETLVKVMTYLKTRLKIYRNTLI